MPVNELLKKLTDADGLPSNEKQIREIIKSELEGHVDIIYSDRVGNLIAVKNSNASPHIALSAHMDEVGLVITGIDASGLIRFGSWGVDPRVLVGKIVRIGTKKVLGVIGAKPIHKQRADERNKALTLDDLYIDIGVSSKADAEKAVSLGDYMAFESEYTEFGDYKVKAKALDDRVGCATIIEVMKSPVNCKLTAVFTSQEEVGLRGSTVAANKVDAEVVINIEGTICADTSGVDPHKRVTSQGCGPAISIADLSSIYLKKYVDEIIKIANENDIPWQYRRTGAGGTDAAMFHQAKGGCPVIGLAVPCRYIHSPVSVMDKRDYENLIKLVKCWINAHSNGADNR